MKRLIVLLCLLLIACASTEQAPVEEQAVDVAESSNEDMVENEIDTSLDEPVQQEDGSSVQQAIGDDVKASSSEEDVHQENAMQGSETATKESKDYAECWKDSDCGQDCADIYTVNVYKCDLRQHTCVPDKYEPYDTINCKEAYGYQWRCRVGQCMKGN